MKLVLATKNRDKVKEIRSLFRDIDLTVLDLSSYPEVGDIIETGNSFRENALIKAHAVRNVVNEWILADDSGLMVDALDGAPGIYSSRYAGEERGHNKNNMKLLEELRDIPDDRRNAAFICSMILLSPDGREYGVEKRCRGRILKKLRGEGGFGYDPLFYLPKKDKTMAELDMDEKNEISHRGKALREIRELLLDILRCEG